jgi:hypothetical protein
MSLALSNLPQSVDLAGYVPASEAAELLGRNADGFSRTCRAELATMGLAIVATSPATGQNQWFIKRSYDPRLITESGQVSEDIPDLHRVSGKRRERAIMQWACVLELRKLRQFGREPLTTALPRLIESLRGQYPSLTLSRSALFRWDKKAGDGDITALIDTRGGVQAPKASAEAWAAFEDLYLHQNQPTVRHCWKLVQALAAQNGWRWISYSQCDRQLNSKIPQEKQAFHRTPKIYRTRFAPYIPQHEESWRAGQLYVSDHKQMDFWVAWRGQIIRPWLTSWMDWRTRRIVGWILSDNPDSSTILGSFRQAMKDPSNFGGPAEVRIDNGNDFASFVFHGSTKQERRLKVSPRIEEDAVRGIYAMLSIAVHFALPYGPNGKSRCERFFGNIASFARGFETFCGISSETRPEKLKGILANPAKIPTFAEAETRLAAFIDEYNNDADHQMDDLSENGVKLSPNEAFSKWCDTRRVLADPASLDLLLAHWHKPVTVGRNGISLTIGGQVLHYGHVCESLRPFKSLHKKDRPMVNVSYDPAALESVRVYDAQFCFITVAPMNRVGGVVKGMTRADQAETHRQMAAYRKSLKHQADYSLTSILTPEERVANATARRRQTERHAAELAAQPSSIVGVRTPLDGQSKELQRQEMKIAIGAESMGDSPPPRMDIFEKLASSRPSPARQNHPPRPDLLEQLYRRNA